MKNSKSNNKGITLIALVITIIVLVILVGLTVSVTINTGLIANSKTAVEDYGTAQENEIVALKKVESLTAPRVNGDPSVWEFDETTGTITGWLDMESTEVVIPNYINGVAVKNIDAESFTIGVTKMVVSEGIECIAEQCLSASDLVTIQLPNSLKEIGNNAFAGCFDLKSITIPGASGATIGASAFVSGVLEEVILEEGVKSIGDHAFAGCNLTNVTIPRSVESIGKEAFLNNPENLKLTIKKGSSLTAESPNYPWGLDESQITFEK